MKADLRRDLDVLRKLAYRRIERVGSLLKDIHAIRSSHPDHPAESVIEVIRRWLLMPYTLWPVDFIGIGKHVVSVVQSGGDLGPDISFLIEQVSELPTVSTQRTTATHEHQVEKGRYEMVVRPAARLKFREKERLVAENPTFRKEWRRLHTLFDIPKLRDPRGFLRRRFVQERNFRPDWEFRTEDEKRRFQSVFDAFCHRWHLYGMEGDRPLVLKLSVNLTAHGTMILVPAFWSFDRIRDLDWSKIMKLHRPRVVTRQGPVLSVGRMERKRLAKEAKKLWEKLRQAGYKSDDFYRHIKQGLGLDQRFTDREIRRLRKEAEN